MKRQVARLETSVRRARRVELTGDALCWSGVGAALFDLLGELAWGWSGELILPFILVALVGMAASVLGALYTERYGNELETLAAVSQICPAWHNAGMGYDSDGTWWRIPCALGAAHSGHLHQDASGEVFVQVLTETKEASEQ